MLRDAKRIVHILFGLHFQAFLPRPHQILVLFLILKRQQIFNLLIFAIPLHIHPRGHGVLCRINSLYSLKLALDIPEVNNHTPIYCYLSIRGDPILLAIDLHPIPTVRIGDCKRFLGDFQNGMFGRYGKLLDADGVLWPAADGIDAIEEGDDFGGEELRLEEDYVACYSLPFCHNSIL